MKKTCHLLNIIISAFTIIPVITFSNTVPDTLRALRIHSEIDIDGDLEESPWQEADKASRFIQRELKEGQPSTEETAFAVVYDRSNLYLGIWAYDSEPDKIIAKETKRDFSWGSEDNFEIILGPFNDNRNGYLFVINPNGAMADVLITDEGNGYNLDWNGVWEAAVEMDDEGWFAEIKIPFSTLKFPEMKEQIWALNMERNIRRKNEQILWQGWSRDYDLERISQAGRLTGISDIYSANLWEVKPYITSGLEKEKGESPSDRINFGGDINYLITPKMKLNVTMNTDFSQVESDREEINLTRFSLFYPEKREFFLEGKNLFEFGLGDDAQLFYSRRIGLHERKEVPIVGGLRMVGKAGKTNIGMMSIQSGEKGSLPSTNFSVMRLKQDVFGQSNIGMIITSKSDKDQNNLAYGIDANYLTSRFLGDKNLEMGIAFSQSFDDGQSQKQNIGYKAYLIYPNDFADFTFLTSTIGKNYNPGIGFLRRKDYQLIFSELELKPRPSFLPLIRNLELVPFEMQYYYTDQTHQLESAAMEFRPMGFKLKTGDVFEFNIQRSFDRLDENFEITDGVEIPSEAYWFTRYEFVLESFEGRSVFSEFQYSWGEFYDGQRTETALNLGINLSRKCNLTVDWEHNQIQLSHSSFSTDELGGRFEYGFNPNLYTSLFGQWNNEDDEIILNYRIHWIPNSGSYFYFVINQELSTANGSISLFNTTVITKLIWRFSM